MVMWCKSKFVSKFNSTRLNFAMNNHLVLFHLVENRDTKWCYSISWLNWHLIEYFDEGGSGVPVANAAVNAFNDILACKTGDRNPEEVLLLIAASR